MKVTKARVVTLVEIMVSSLLLSIVANCSLDKIAERDSAAKQVKHSDVNEQPESEYYVANSFCFACHIDFDEEELALSHEVVGIGCERCHGESQRHRSDEKNITPPEIMYPKAKINPTCMMCHPRQEIKKTLEHTPILAVVETALDENTEESISKAGKQKEYCTDCHGQRHRMKVRTVRWDKATGKLLNSSE
jgi:hypothetical protein